MMCEICRSEHRLKSLEEDRERNSAQHKEFYEKFEMTNTANARFEEKFERIMDTLAEIKKDLNDLKDKPNKRWESVVGAIIGAVIVVAVNYFVNGGCK